MKNWLATVLSQFGNSPKLLALINSFNDAIDPSTDIDSFVTEIWDISTATGYGLDVWGRIVGVSRSLYIPGAAGKSFGFTEAGTLGADPFNQSPFYSGVLVSGNFDLSDTFFRRLILVKAFANISDRSIPSFNAALLQMFPNRGNAYVADIGSMTAQLRFGFILSPVERAILLQSGAFPGPTGVLMQVVDLDPKFILGFAEAGSGYATFNNGSFA